MSNSRLSCEWVFNDSRKKCRVLVLRPILESRMAVGGGNGPGTGTQAIFSNQVPLAYQANFRLKDYPTPSPDTTTIFFTQEVCSYDPSGSSPFPSTNAGAASSRDFCSMSAATQRPCVRYFNSLSIPRRGNGCERESIRSLF